MKNFVTRWKRRRKMRKLNIFLVRYGFIMEYMKSVDRYCGSFVDHHTKYGDLIGSNILWFEGSMNIEDIQSIIKERFDNNLFYEEPTYYKKEQ